MCKFRLDFSNLDFCTLRFISKNAMSKVILKYQDSMLTCPSVHPANPKTHSRITATVNPLSQLYINWKFQKYISFNICPCHRTYFMRSLFIAFQNDKWCHFVVRICSIAFISFFCECVVSFYFSLFSYFFVESTTSWGMQIRLAILIIKQWSCS